MCAMYLPENIYRFLPTSQQEKIPMKRQTVTRLTICVFTDFIVESWQNTYSVVFINDGDWEAIIKLKDNYARVVTICLLFEALSHHWSKKSDGRVLGVNVLFIILKHLKKYRTVEFFLFWKLTNEFSNFIVCIYKIIIK